VQVTLLLRALPTDAAQAKQANRADFASKGQQHNDCNESNLIVT